MKTVSNQKPQNKFEIEQIDNNNCEIIFYTNIEEKQNEDNTEYNYELYRLAHSYIDNLDKELENEETYNKFLSAAREQEYNEYASKIREKRNKLLEETDKDMCIDRLGIELCSVTEENLLASVQNFFNSLQIVTNSEMSKYRQELRDITEQENFPYEVVFPKKPEKNFLDE